MDNDIIDLEQIFRALLRGKWMLAFAVVVGAFLGWYYGNRIATPLYSANTTVVLDPQADASISGLSSVVQGISSDTVTVSTEVEVMRSRILLGKVVDSLNLTQDSEFSPWLAEPGLGARIIGGVQGLFGSEAPIEPQVAPERARNAAISILLGKINIQILPSTRVYRISVTTTNPDKSVRIVDAIATAYIGQQLDEKFQAAEDATTWLTNRVSELRSELETAETRVKVFNASTDLISQEVLLGQERQLKDLRDRAQSTQQRLNDARDRVAALQAAQGYEDRSDVAQDPELTELSTNLDTAAGREAFDARYEQLVRDAQVIVARPQRQIAPIEASMETLQEQVDRRSQDLIELQQLTREAEATRLLYEYFLSRLKETSVQQGIQQADSRVLSEAVRRGSPSSPNRQLLQIIGGILGFILVAAVLIVRELKGETFRTANQLESFGGRTVMGQIPMVANMRQKRGVIEYLQNKPTSAAAEAIRNLRTSVMLSNPDHPPQVIAVTSCVPGEGKTTVSIALGMNFCGLGKKVLLLEGDIRRRVLSSHLNVDSKHGMMSVVLGDQKFEDVVVTDPVSGADVLVSEHSEMNAVDFFSSAKFHNFLAELRTKYDVIIIDTPPVLVVPDVRVIAGLADALLFIVRWDSTKQPQVQEAMRIFNSVGQPVTGFILNHISERGMKTYGYGGRYGSYAEYGRKYYNE